MKVLGAVDSDRRLRHMEWTLWIIAHHVIGFTKQGEKLMAVGQDILDAVTREDTKIDSVIALLQGLVNSGTIPQSVLDAIQAKIAGSETKLDAAIAANTTPPPA